jgi:2-phosphosulfolactate phosphatase
MSYFSQQAHSVRLEWGLGAIRHLAPEVDCVVVIDIMSFTTCVNIAVERGAVIYPYPWRDETAQAYGAERGAQVASSKRRFSEGWSLSPTSLQKVPSGLHLVLPSPNGSAATFNAMTLGRTVYCASFRNLRATVAACRHHRNILVVPCGERWPDDSLRPSFEDYLAAGGVVSALGRSDSSPEARAAAMAYEQFGVRRRDALMQCGSAIELVHRGFAGDVALCLEEDVSVVACRLDGDHFVAETCPEAPGQMFSQSGTESS